MFTAAFWLAIWTYVKAYILANGLTVAWKVTPFLVVLGYFGYVYLKGGVPGLVAIAIVGGFGYVAYLELTGEMPAIKLPTLPITPAK